MAALSSPAYTNNMLPFEIAFQEGQPGLPIAIVPEEAAIPSAKDDDLIKLVTLTDALYRKTQEAQSEYCELNQFYEDYSPEQDFYFPKSIEYLIFNNLSRIRLLEKDCEEIIETRTEIEGILHARDLKECSDEGSIAMREKIRRRMELATENMAFYKGKQLNVLNDLYILRTRSLKQQCCALL